ncbi:MAG TPA: MaoC/PaaZ C-terminal domain-containing protein [Ferrovibrio sp.]|uniref:MaoC/PaaZ C-terminal domain-containing protein n=1 Tax=Ferrovibrio sp. TaxID=1917215 RepID=UPI002B4B55E5|nr:MaoC/PaaZ C-terminal domain-containing protein [Ferrovibrio sp.]HLT77352.1 MaoC/PaaZ C-terminal domain-containing protein [Ferrovibrio sp.]
MTTLSLERPLSQSEFDLFARISGDNNPIHVDAEFSSRTRFGRTVSHGMLLYTILWGLVQKQYPGAKQLSQDLMFPNPAYADEPLRFEIAETAASGNERTLSTRASRMADGAVVLDGRTTITLS